MSFSVSTWVQEYKSKNPDESVVYIGTNLDYPDDQYEFSNISSYAAKQGHLKDEDIIRVLEWVRDGRSSAAFRANYGNGSSWPSGRPQNHTQRILSSNFGYREDIEKLTEMPGVRVGAASGLLTVMRPAQNAVLGPKRLRALPVAAPNLDITVDPMRIEWASALEKWNTLPEVYEYYMRHIDDIKAQTGATAREVDMALWAFDEDRRQTVF